MIPLVGHVNELRIEREVLEREVKQVLAENGNIRIPYSSGP
jgi:signal transduction protein with GAF and PtsI domain